MPRVIEKLHKIDMEISLSKEEIKPRLIVVAGPNGVGKTSITQLLLYQVSTVYWSYHILNVTILQGLSVPD